MNSKDKPLFLDIDDAHNAINSNILKQTMIGQEPRGGGGGGGDDDGGILAASNGKHENGDADYDYSDLGPETDVDAIDDVPSAMPVKNLSYEFYKDNDDGTDRDSNLLDNMNVDQSTNANFNANVNAVHETMIDNNLREVDEDEEDDDDDDDEDEDEDEDVDVRERGDNDIRGDDARDEIALSRTVRDGIVENIHGIIHEEMDNRVREQLDEEEEEEDDEEARKDKVRVDDLQDVVDKAGGPVDYDDSPPSLQANKPLQHALINEADNVADSEDSEDEWNYYRVDPNKEKESTTPVNESLEARNDEACEVSDRPIEEDNELKIQSEGVQEDIKCEDSKEEPLELLINTEISTLERTLEPEDKERARLEEQENLKDMDFQLNPNAAEFIPVSPQFAEPRMSLVEDYPVSGSPFKQVPQMDDIQVPSQSEFEKEVCQRPREVENDEKEYQNGDNLQRADCADFASERQKATSNLDDSEISSTKAEFGDESTASFLTASEFHRTGITVDESFSSSERDYDIAKDPMAMSYTPSDFEAAFDKGVDLNAVHNLSNTDLDEKNGMEKEDEDLIGECGDFQADSTNAAAHDLVTVEEKVSEVPEESAVLVNLPSHQEECEDTFIAPADEPTEEKTVDLLNLQSEPTQEQQEIARYDHSPLTENYSGEFPESEKEPVSVDNEQPLSPSSVDIDETKPIDEASEDAALPIESDLQKEACINEAADTPSSLSPVPDAMEDDVAAAATVAVTAAAAAPANVSENLNLSTLHADAPEFVPGHYSVQDFEGDEACQLSPAEATDVCQMSPAEPVENAFEPIKEDLVATMERDEKEVDELCAKPAVQENLLNFAEEENVCAKPPQVDDQLTPPLSPQKIEKIVEDVVCPFESSVSREHEDKFGLKETPEETNLLESKTKQIEEAMMEPEQPAEQSVIANEMLSPIKERTMNLSDSMQEFTGLEKQLQPKEDDILAASVVADTIKDIKEEEVKEDVQPEKLVDLVAEEPCKTEEKVEESLPSEPKEIETLETKEPEVNVPEIKPEAKVEEEPKEQVEEPKEKTEIKEENKVSEVAAAVAATAAVAAAGTAAAAAAAVAAQSKAKPKTSSAAKSATKTTAAKTAAPKSNPTSPSKTTAAATRTSTAATKKPSTIAAARPKDLDAPKKATASSTTASKPLTPKSSKTATTTTTVAAAAAKSSTTRMSAASKTKLVASPKPADKKPTANGDVKPLSKPAAAKPAVTKSSATKTSTTTAKAASTTARPAGTTTTITMSKPRPASATTKTTTSMTTKSSSTATSSATTATSTPRPKTAPISGTATKTRLLAKSPIIDKQVKETANKQISMARTTAGASKTTATRSSVASSTTSSSTTARRVSSTTKTTATSQTRKSTTATSKVTKTSTVGKTTAVEKPKIVQNGVSEKVEINAIIDDVPKKDLSPVVAPNDNQLIASSD